MPRSYSPIYLPYGVFPDWSSFRFLMPALPMAFAAVGAISSEALDRLAAPVRGIVMIASLTLLVSLNVTHAAQQSVYVVRDYEARYRTVGLYLAASQPPDTVILTSQQSGSAHYYTGLPIVRWDLLAVDLDTAIARLRALGRHRCWSSRTGRSPCCGNAFLRCDGQPRLAAARRGGTDDTGRRVGSSRPRLAAASIITDHLP